MIELLKDAARLGWKVEIEGSTVTARRVAVGGRCGRETDMDGGIAIANSDLGYALHFVLQKIVSASRPIERQYRSPAAVARKLGGAPLPAAFVDSTAATAARDIKLSKRRPSAAARLPRLERQVRGLNSKGLLK